MEESIAAVQLLHFRLPLAVLPCLLPQNLVALFQLHNSK
jgi:hypothetical protein